MVFWNALGARWLMKQPLDYRALAGGVIGIVGLMMLFWDELLRFSWLDSGFGCTDPLAYWEPCLQVPGI